MLFHRCPSFQRFCILCNELTVNSIFFDRLVERIGFPWTVRAMGFLILGIQIIAILTVRSRLDHKPKPFNLANFSRPFKDRAFVLNSLACLAGMLGTLIPFNYLKVSAQAANVSPNLATYLLPIINASSYVSLPLSYSPLLTVGVQNHRPHRAPLGRRPLRSLQHDHGPHALRRNPCARTLDSSCFQYQCNNCLYCLVWRATRLF